MLKTLKIISKYDKIKSGDKVQNFRKGMKIYGKDATFVSKEIDKNSGGVVYYGDYNWLSAGFYVYTIKQRRDVGWLHNN